ncbi:MAG: hypothetical protein ACXQS2_02695 [Methermicoccaceae archaeon]
MYELPELDTALEALTDYRSELVAFRCTDCGAEFYYQDDTAKFCPKCGSMNIEPEYNRDVELLDFGYRRE